MPASWRERDREPHALGGRDVRTRNARRGSGLRLRGPTPGASSDRRAFIARVLLRARRP
ncbi:MAG: hypothetical protein NZ898_08070 [Myxococcota bacterium]|nr:hypothetical protein [Myxococcota bacterium]MDW8363181.1 hypothetical protein [Myxococcales bacterium]